MNKMHKTSLRLITFSLVLGIPLLSQLACGGSNSENPSPLDAPLAAEDLGVDVARWESRMLSEGRNLCKKLRNLDASSEKALAETYYDALWVFWQIAEYTRDPSWQECASFARSIYRDEYVLPNKGQVPGYWNFTHGLARDYEKTNDPLSKKALQELIQNAAYSRSSTPLRKTADSELSREVAYAIMGYLNGKRAGLEPPKRLFELRNQAFGHINQWFKESSSKTLKPFMAGLTAQALIEAHETYPDERTLPALKGALDELWKVAWQPQARAFRYQTRNPSAEERKPAPDLNLLLAPAYLWVYRQNKQPRFLDRARVIFSGGVENGFISNGKQFNQNYRWSFQYVKWLREALETR